MRKEVAINLTPPTSNIIFKAGDSLKSCKVKVNGRQVKFNASTCIDKASKLVHANLKTKHNMLRTLVHANLKTKLNVLRTLVHANLKAKYYVLRTLVHADPPCNVTQASDIINEALATGMHAQTTVATTIGSTQGSLAYAQDMFLKVSLITDWLTITQACEYHSK